MSRAVTPAAMSRVITPAAVSRVVVPAAVSRVATPAAVNRIVPVVNQVVIALAILAVQVFSYEFLIIFCLMFALGATSNKGHVICQI